MNSPCACKGGGSSSRVAYMYTVSYVSRNLFAHFMDADMESFILTGIQVKILQNDKRSTCSLPSLI